MSSWETEKPFISQHNSDENACSSRGNLERGNGLSRQVGSGARHDESRGTSEARRQREIHRDNTRRGAALGAGVPTNRADERGVRPPLGGLLGIHVVFLFVYHSATAARLGRTHLIFIPHMKVKGNDKKKIKKNLHCLSATEHNLS